MITKHMKTQFILYKTLWIEVDDGKGLRITKTQIQAKCYLLEEQ